MPNNTNAKRKMPIKIMLLLIPVLAVCLLLLYFVPVSESVQKTSPYTRFSSGGIAQDNGEMQLDLRYRHYLLKPDVLVGNITLTSETDGQQRVVEIDDPIVEIDGTTEDMHLRGFVYDEASGDSVSALIYCADDFDAVFISIGDDDYYDPAYSSIAPDILSNYFLK